MFSGMNPTLLAIILCFKVLQVNSVVLDLKSTQASLSGRKMMVEFAVMEGSPPYNIRYWGVPLGWDSEGSQLVVSDFSQSSMEQWSFDIIVRDNGSTLLFQTVKMILREEQIQLIPVTQAVEYIEANAGLLQEQTETHLNGITSLKIVKSTFNFQEIISRYPGVNQTSNIFTETFQNRNKILITPKVTQENDSLSQTTENLIRIKAAALRQQEAQKAIINIVTAIQSLEAQISASTKIVLQYEVQLKASTDYSNQCEFQKYSIQNLKAKTQNSIKDRTERIDQIGLQLKMIAQKTKDLQEQLDNLRVQKNQQSNLVKPEGTKLNKYQALLTDCQETNKLRKKIIAQKNSEISENQLSISFLEREIQDSSFQQGQTALSLDKVGLKIKTLKEQLIKAQEEELELTTRQAYYKSVPQQGLSKIKAYQLLNKKIEEEISQLMQTEMENIQKCNGYQIEIKQLKNEIAVKAQKFKQIVEQVDSILLEVQFLSSRAQIFLNNKENLALQIKGLQNEQNKFAQRLTQEQYLCDLSQEQVRNFQVLLKAEKKKLEQHLDDKKEAGVYLEKARKQKQTSDKQVQEIGTKNLQKQTSKASPAQNLVLLADSNSFKSSVSAAQPKVDEQQESKEQYLLSNDQKELITNPSSGVSGLSSFKCESSQQVQSYHGLLQSVGLGSLKVRDQLNQQYTLSLSACTTISSTKNYLPVQPGSTVFFSGHTAFQLLGSRLFNAYSILIIPK